MINGSTEGERLPREREGKRTGGEKGALEERGWKRSRGTARLGADGKSAEWARDKQKHKSSKTVLMMGARSERSWHERGMKRAEDGGG